MAAPQVVQVLDLDQDSILLDSNFRDVKSDNSSYDFRSNLQADARGASRLQHTSIIWQQDIFAHNRENNTIRLEIDGNLYETYMTPYVVHTTPDGTDEQTPFATPVQGSYAADLEGALNLVYDLAGGTFVSPATFEVRYSKSTGFVIRCTSASVWRIVPDCSWITKAYFVHGFGKNSGSFLNPIILLPVHGDTLVADSPPVLAMARYFTVSSASLTESRKTSSFSNNVTSAVTNQELNVFHIDYSKNNTLNVNSTFVDPTIVNVEGMSTQNADIFLVLDTGVRMRGQAGIWCQIIQAAGDTFTVADLCVSPRPNAVMAVLRQIAVGNSAFSFIQSNVTCSNAEVVHKLLYQARRTR